MHLGLVGEQTHVPNLKVAVALGVLESLVGQQRGEDLGSEQVPPRVHQFFHMPTQLEWSWFVVAQLCRVAECSRSSSLQELVYHQRHDVLLRLVTDPDRPIVHDVGHLGQQDSELGVAESWLAADQRGVQQVVQRLLHDLDPGLGQPVLPLAARLDQSPLGTGSRSCVLDLGPVKVVLCGLVGELGLRGGELSPLVTDQTAWNPMQAGEDLPHVQEGVGGLPDVWKGLEWPL